MSGGLLVKKCGGECKNGILFILAPHRFLSHLANRMTCVFVNRSSYTLQLGAPIK